MERALAPCVIRRATADDYSDYVALFPELGIDDRPPTRERFVEEMAATTLLAQADTSSSTSPRTLGVVYYRDLGATVLVGQIMVARDARRTGVGRRLIAAVADEARRKADAARAAGAPVVPDALCLNVLPTNAPAIALYVGAGFERVHVSSSFRLLWSVFDAVPAVEREADRGRVRVFGAGDDARLERAFGIGGRIGAARGKEGRAFFVLERADERGETQPVGLALFDTTFPGASPFFAASRADALALLGAMRERALPSDDHTLLTAEGDPARAAILEGIGAHRRFDMVFMRSPLATAPTLRA